MIFVCVRVGMYMYMFVRVCVCVQSELTYVGFKKKYLYIRLYI